jgi:serine-type D-Ala-D-Ala carboxypeptidase (penicillin-binding protein 5/6)
MKRIAQFQKNLKRFFRKHTLRVIKFSFLALFLLLLPAPNAYFFPVAKSEGLKVTNQINLGPAPDYPVNSTQVQAPLLSAGAVLVKDIPSGVILYAKNENMRFPPASTTKIMTALVALENYSLDDVFTVPDISLEPSIMKLVPGEKITVESLLYGALVHSANDAAYTLASNYPGGYDAFIQKMNQKAQMLNLADTHFTNSVGFDDDNHYSTASDLAKQALAGLSNKTFVKIVGTKNITVSDVTYTYFHDLKNVNELLGKIPGVMGVKTGFTQNAGEVLISEVKKNDHSILIVLLKSNDRFGETTKLIDWVFGNFNWIPINEFTQAIAK